MNNAMEQISAILVAVVGVAIIAVLVNQNAQTSSVISSAGSAFSSILGTAMGGVTGTSSSSSTYGGVTLPKLG